MAAQESAIPKYETLFQPQEQHKRFPIERFYMNNALTEQFDWTLVYDEEPVCEKTDGDIYSDLEMEQIIKKAHRTAYSQEYDENIYYIKYGDIWVGSLK